MSGWCYSAFNSKAFVCLLFGRFKRRRGELETRELFVFSLHSCRLLLYYRYDDDSLVYTIHSFRRGYNVTLT